MLREAKPGRRHGIGLPARLLRGRAAYDERTGFKTMEDSLTADDYGVLTDNRFGQADVREPGSKD